MSTTPELHTLIYVSAKLLTWQIPELMIKRSVDLLHAEKVFGFGNKKGGSV